MAACDSVRKKRGREEREESRGEGRSVRETTGSGRGRKGESKRRESESAPLAPMLKSSLKILQSLSLISSNFFSLQCLSSAVPLTALFPPNFSTSASKPASLPLPYSPNRGVSAAVVAAEGTC